MMPKSLDLIRNHSTNTQVDALCRPRPPALLPPSGLRRRRAGAGEQRHVEEKVLSLPPYPTHHTPFTLLHPHLHLFAALCISKPVGNQTPYILLPFFPPTHPPVCPFACRPAVDESGKMLAVPVRVGTAVDTVAQAGRPKTITGFQTHTTPVLLAVGERAELGTEKYIAGAGGGGVCALGDE